MIKTGKELAAAAEYVARNLKTLYVHGAFGWPMTGNNKTRAANASAFNRKPERLAAITAATADTFGCDCIGLIKTLLWGFEGDASHQYGGAKYQSNGVPDIDEAAMLDACTDVSADFGKIHVGEYLWTEGHCGIYVGGGYAVECTHRWGDGVQLTAVYNLVGESSYPNGRYWSKHGKLPYITYEAEEAPETGKPNAGDYTLAFRHLRKGCEGEDVRAVQSLLISRNYSCGGKGADGIFGSKTDSAVRAFQSDCEITVDGVVGEETMRRLVGVVT